MFSALYLLFIPITLFNSVCVWLFAYFSFFCFVSFSYSMFFLFFFHYSSYCNVPQLILLRKRKAQLSDVKKKKFGCKNTLLRIH